MKELRYVTAGEVVTRYMIDTMALAARRGYLRDPSALSSLAAEVNGVIRWLCATYPQEFRAA